MAMAHHKLAIFDIDGTIAKNGVIPDEVLEGIKHLRRLGYTTTISTGRGYVRIRELFGDTYEAVVSPDALIIMEHGTKVVNRDGEIEFAEYLDEADIENVLDLIRANIEIVKIVWFNRSGADERVQVWVYDERDLEFEQDKRGHYADVAHGTLGLLREMLLEYRLSNVTARLRDHVKVQNLQLAVAHVPLSLVFLDGNMEFIKSNANKGLAVLHLLNKYGMGPEDLLVAGNAINDLEMLDIEAAHRIVVGPAHERDPVLARLSEPAGVTRLESPRDFGVWMKNLS